MSFCSKLVSLFILKTGILNNNLSVAGKWTNFLVFVLYHIPYLTKLINLILSVINIPTLSANKLFLSLLIFVLNL